MSAIKIKSRNIGANAAIGRIGYPDVTSFTGGKVDLVTSADGAGFNPLDLLFASLASCMAISIRVAASEKMMLDRFEKAQISVSGEKTDGDFKRIDKITLVITIDGQLSDEEKRALMLRAKAICTVSNTLLYPPNIEMQTS